MCAESRNSERWLLISLFQFDAEFTSEAPLDSVVEDSVLSSTVQAQFQGFTYGASFLSLLDLVTEHIF